jgi:hypothetical protein
MANEYLITRIIYVFRDGKRRMSKVKKSVYDIESFRKYLFETNNGNIPEVVSIQFVYDTIPGNCKRELKLSM